MINDIARRNDQNILHSVFLMQIIKFEILKYTFLSTVVIVIFFLVGLTLSLKTDE